jgi:aralkylamine N-acetyltransferase
MKPAEAGDADRFPFPLNLPATTSILSVPDEVFMIQIAYEIITDAPTESIVRLYEAGGWWRESAEARAVIPEMIRRSFCFMVARDSEAQIVGMGRVISDGVSDAYIQDIVVLNAYRGQGIGAGIVRRLARHCAERKIGWIGLVAEPGTYEFYKKIGFELKQGFELMLYGNENK